MNQKEYIGLNTKLWPKLVDHFNTYRPSVLREFDVFGNAAISVAQPSGPGGNVDVPEPSTLAIFALGMIGLASRRYKKQSL